MVLTYFWQLYVNFLLTNRLANPVSMNGNWGLTLKNENEKTSRVFRWIMFLVRRDESSFYCRILIIIIVAVPRAAVWCYVISSFLSSNRLFKIFRSYDKTLVDWVRSGRTGKHLVLVQDVRTSLRSPRTSWPRAKYFPVRPSHSVNEYITVLGWIWGYNSLSQPAVANNGYTCLTWYQSMILSLQTSQTRNSKNWSKLNDYVSASSGTWLPNS